MLRKFAVALVAASVLTAPAFAQGNSAPATTAKVVNANPSLKSAKFKAAKHHARHHVKHVKHVAHVKRIKHVRVAHAAHGTKVHKHIRHVVSKSTSGQTGAMTAPKAKSNVN